MADAALNETSYGYTEEERAHLLTDQVNLIGSTTTTGLAFGVVLTLYLICLNTLVKDLRTDRRKTAVIGIAYTTVMFLLGALYCASNARTTQEAYVDNKGFPGGPNAYANFIFDQPITIAGLVAFFGANWMTDAILVSLLASLARHFLPFAADLATQRPVPRLPLSLGSPIHAVSHVPHLLQLVITSFHLTSSNTSSGMSIVTIVQSSQPTQSFYATAVVPFNYAYYSISVSMTVLATSLMVGKIWMVRRKYQSVMGESALKTMVSYPHFDKVTPLTPLNTSVSQQCSSSLLRYTPFGLVSSWVCMSRATPSCTSSWVLWLRYR